MQNTFRQFSLSLGAGLAALALTAGMYAASQDPNTSGGPGPFMGRRGGPPMGGMGPNELLTPEQQAQARELRARRPGPGRGRGRGQQ